MLEIYRLEALRHVKQLLRNDFAAACFCVLMGIKIIVRGSPARAFNLMVCLRKLLPEQLHRLIQIDAQQFLTNSECRIVSVKPDVVVPIASSATFRIDFLGNENDRLSVKWPGEMPNKWPDLLLKIIKAVDEERFTDLMLNKQTRVLVEEWKNKVICLKTGEKVKVDQAHLETVIPALDKPVLVVNEAYRGQEAILKKLDEKNFCVTIEIARGPLKGRIVEGVQYEDISKMK